MKRRKLFTLPLAALLLCGALVWSLGGAPDLARAAQVQTPSDGVGRITVEEFRTLLAGKAPITVIDVRDRATEKIKGALVIPVGDIEARLDEIPRDREIITYCA